MAFNFKSIKSFTSSRSGGLKSQNPFVATTSTTSGMKISYPLMEIIGVDFGGYIGIAGDDDGNVAVYAGWDEDAEGNEAISAVLDSGSKVSPSVSGAKVSSIGNFSSRTAWSKMSGNNDFTREWRVVEGDPIYVRYALIDGDADATPQNVEGVGIGQEDYEADSTNAVALYPIEFHSEEPKQLRGKHKAAALSAEGLPAEF